MAEEANGRYRNSENLESSKTYRAGIPGGEIGAPPTALSSEILALKDQPPGEADQRQRAQHHQEQLYWAKRSASFAIVLSALSLAVAAMTAWILWQTFGVYKGQRAIMNAQASIMANQATISRNEVDTANFSNRLLELETVANVGVIQSLPAVNGHASLTFKNTGKTSAKNVEVEVAYMPAVNPPEDFDPFVDARKTLDDLVNSQKQFVQQARREETLKVKGAKVIKDPRTRKTTQLRIRESFDDRIKMAQETTKSLEQRPYGRTYSDSIGELPADAVIDFPLDFHLGEAWLNDPSHFAYAFGTYRYEDQLGHLHQNLRFCYRYGSNGSVASCLRFQPSDTGKNTRLAEQK